jgi:MFS transporter, AAHS family, vanillate permease
MSLQDPTVEISAATSASSADERNDWHGLSVVVVGLCFLLNMLDGADLLIMSFVAPVLAVEWQVSPERLGVVFSASLAGMAIGCLLVAPLADRFGRRAMILGALVVVAAAMMASGFVTTVPALIAMRLLVGVGVGTIGVSMTAMATEFAPEKHASFAAGVVQAGWPIGSIATALVAAQLIEGYGWQALLAGIGAASVALLAVVALTLPESVAFLLGRQPPRALERVNAILPRLGRAALLALPPRSARARTFNVAELFRAERRRASVLLFVAVTFGYFVLYFVISWIPTLAIEAGLALEDGIYAGATYNAGAFVGTALVAWLAIGFRLNRVIALFFALAVVAMLVFGNVRMPVALTLAAAAAVGVTVQGAFNGFWALAARLYPAEIRGTGIGWALGVGRIGAVLGPIVGGVLVGAGVSVGGIFALYTLPAIVAAALCLAIPGAAPTRAAPSARRASSTLPKRSS